MISLRLPAVAALAALASTASAQTTSWNFGDTSAPGACARTSAGGTNGLGNVWECAAQPDGTQATLRVRAFTATGSGAAATLGASAITPQGTSSGLGVGSGAEGGTGASGANGEHALDNNGGLAADLLLLEFLTPLPQRLDRVTVGWSNSDADFQVLRWAGWGAPTLAGQSVGGLLGSGWRLASAVNGAATGGTDRAYDVNPGGLGSNFWIVSAYHPGFGTTAGFKADHHADRFKLLGVTATTVPEPSTYALLGAGLAGLAAAARRRRA